MLGNCLSCVSCEIFDKTEMLNQNVIFSGWCLQNDEEITQETKLCDDYEEEI